VSGRPLPTRFIVALMIGLGLAGCGGAAAGVPAAGVVRSEAGRPARVSAVTHVGTAPTAVAVGAGAVWVANSGDGTVDRLDPATGRVTGRPTTVGPGPLAVAIGEGGVWVATGDGMVRRIDPRTRRLAPGGAAVTGVAGLATGEGAVWATSTTAGTLVRIDPRTGRADGKPMVVGRGPTDVAVGGGAVWVADAVGGDVARVDPGTGRVTGRTPVAPAQPYGQVLALTYGEGGVWVARTSARLAQPIDVLRLDPASGHVTGPILRVTGRVGMALAAGAGEIWATDAGNFLSPDPRRAPALLRIDPSRQALAGAPARVGSGPAGVAVGDGAVWVTSADTNRVDRIVPPAGR